VYATIDRRVPRDCWIFAEQSQFIVEYQYVDVGFGPSPRAIRLCEEAEGSVAAALPLGVEEVAPRVLPTLSFPRRALI